jgi:hypothetical protein
MIQAMPITYERDDARQLITVTVTEPYVVDDVLDAIDRQSIEGTSGYAAIYDVRAADLLTGEDAERLHARLAANAATGHRPGPTALRVALNPDQFAMGHDFTKRAGGLIDLEVLVTARQFEEWLVRNAHSVRDPRR